MLVYSSLFVQNLSESTPGPDEEYNVSTTPGAPLEETTNRLAARVEPYDKGDREQYDVIDVATATGTVMGKPRSGQTTRIYTTGEVDESFWLKHLGDDFKHAIHLQVGGTNEEYNRLINRTQNGVHEEVHHEYLPGPNDLAAQSSLHLLYLRHTNRVQLIVRVSTIEPWP